MIKRQRPVSEIIDDIINYIENAKLKQISASIQLHTSQSTISRIMRKRPKKLTRSILKICNYANIDTEYESKVDPTKNRELIDALQDVWDGTPRHAAVLSKLIRCLGDLGPNKK